MTVAQPAMLAALSFDPTRLDGWFELPFGPWNVFKVPLGVLALLPLVPMVRLAGPRHLATGIVLASLLLAWATLGAAYAALLVVAAGWSWTAVRISTKWLASAPGQSRRAVLAGSALLVVPYCGLLLRPQPIWLPRVEPPLYFYLQWAGIGYLTLKALSVIADLARQNPPRPRPASFAAYLLFAPTLRMGPIYRYGEFCAELEAARAPLSLPTAGAGAIRIAVGLLKLGLMAVLLHNLPAERLFGTPEKLSTLRLVLSVYAAPLSIYLWIAGYSDVAIGLGRLCGMRVPENFHSPWLSCSIRDFWRRWHIPLGQWVRDYLYFPLGGARRHATLNYFIAFTFVGVWHGLYPSYAAWGMSQGLGLGLNRRWRLFWERQRDGATPLYGACRRAGLIDAPLGAALAWLLTLHYQMLTIALFMDEKHCGTRFLPQLFARLRGA